VPSAHVKVLSRTERRSIGGDRQILNLANARACELHKAAWLKHWEIQNCRTSLGVRHPRH